MIVWSSYQPHLCAVYLLRPLSHKEFRPAARSKGDEVDSEVKEGDKAGSEANWDETGFGFCFFFFIKKK